MKVLLDNQQWNYLAAPEEYDGVGLDLDGLRRAVRDGRIEVVGTLDLLQEIISTAPRHGDKYRRMVDLFFEFVGPRMLIPLSRRHVAEAKHAGLLSVDNRYFSRDARRSFMSMARSRRDVLELAGEIYDEGRSFRTQEIAAREQVRSRLGEVDERLNLKIALEWYAGIDIDEWLQPTVEAGVEFKRYGAIHSVPGGYDGYPSAWTFTAFRLAWLVFTLGQNGKIQNSDLADAHHVASGPYVDTIVSDDAGLRRAFDLFSERVPFTTMSSRQISEVAGVASAR